MPRLVLALARGMAVLGGLVLTGLILITCVSVLGGLGNSFFHSAFAESVFPEFAQGALDLGVGPLFGDTEMVEVGMAFVIFCFLPLCQISGSHASVDIFSSRLPLQVNRALQVLIDLIFAVILILIALRLFAGLQEKMQYNETTYDLQFPIWWSYGASLAASGIAALVGVYVAGARVVEATSGRVILPSRQGMDG
ncbi:TRAP transporter small permease [Roseovarius rhodophyticola]|uniref:TRAP transporter small permease protein n=1 Tax=Roseovarius rhodophyticola TaxID=3080827 RepID=A0ABZ2TB30_9RHOB|nr:TRAP transporter small permease [Roseovarius sp. W115]MDV2930618.1 TRAP transporter small permease [Roseovarius sp. W115]